MNEPNLNHDTPAIDRRAEANRANAARSTGPRTEAGKSVSKLNAVKNGLTGRTVLLPEDDVARYEQHGADWQEEWHPQGPRESALVQAIADSHWRSERIVRLEFALYAQGRVQVYDYSANQPALQSAVESDPALQAQLIEAHTYLTYEKHFRNLSIQEARLRRQREKDQAELMKLQEERKTAEAERQELLDRATKVYQTAMDVGADFDPARRGFVFSMAEIEANYARLFGPDEEKTDDEEKEEDEAEDEDEDIPEPGSRWKPKDAA